MDKTSKPVAKKKVHFISLGCPKNLVDSEIMLGELTQGGYEVTSSPEEADSIVVNTCGFIEDAKQESIERILEMAEYKKKGALKNLVVAGCLTQRYKDELVEGLPEADLFVGSGEFQNIHKILEQREQGSKEKKFFDLPTYLQEEKTPRVNSQPQHRAYLKISEGCKKRCAFCAIPKIRGNLHSRRLSAIVSEAKLLAAGGVKELNVISHDFTDYGWDLRRQDDQAIESPARLLQELATIEALHWIRVLYLYPDGADENLIRVMKDNDRLVKYFDMPLQHASNQMLQRMNRKMTREKITQALDHIRKELPEATIRTQFIVGFPGETEKDFEELVAFIQEQEFDRVGCFKYSPEEGTAGHRMGDQVSEEAKEERYHRLMSVQMEISRKKHRRFVGQVLPVLVEGASEESDLLWQGRMAQQAPEIDGVVYINDGRAPIGEIVPVKITESHDYDLVGHIVSSDKASL